MTEQIENDPRIINRLVAYKNIEGGTLEMHLCLPAERVGEQLRPGVVCVHGGGWSGGNRNQFLWHARDLALRGFVATTISYRLSTVATYPAALDDCQSAMRWMRKNAGELGLDPNRLGALGSSAGGHLVACLGVRETRDDSEPELAGFSSKANCVVDVHGVHNLPALAEQNMLLSTTEKFMGGTLSEKEQLWRDASPQLFVDGASAPTLVLHDPGDKTVPYVQSVEFVHALTSAARPVSFIPTPGSGHGFVYGPKNEWTQRVWPDIVAFFTRHLA